MSQGRRARVAAGLLVALGATLLLVPPAAADPAGDPIRGERRELPSPATRADRVEQRDAAPAAPTVYPAKPEVVTVRFAVGKEPRSVTLVRPAGPPRAVLVMLHAHYNSSGSVVHQYGLQPLVRSGVLLVVPSGIRGTWNAGGTCCGWSGVQRVDDLTMIVEATRIGASHAPATAPRVLAGYSSGAVLVARAVCNGASARAGFDAAVIVAGTVPGACTAPAPPRLLVDLHGQLDANIRMHRDTYRRDWRVTLPASATAMSRLRTRSGCATPTVAVAATTRTLVARCPRGEVREVVHTKVGHSYAGLGSAALLRSVVDGLPPRR